MCQIINTRYRFRLTLCVVLLAAGLDATQADAADCNCYAYYDAECKDKVTPGQGEKAVCAWDNDCTRRKPKKTQTVRDNDGNVISSSIVQTNCNTNSGDAAGTVAPCDGVCKVRKEAEKRCAGDNPNDILNAFSQWCDAFLDTAESGGGLVDPGRIALIEAIPLTDDCAFTVSRYAAGVLELCVAGFVEHPETHHELEEHPVWPIVAGSCESVVARACIDAVTATMVDYRTDIGNILEGASGACPQGYPFSAPCWNLGPQSIACIEPFLHSAANSLDQTGACCSPGLTATCELLTELECADEGGQYHGDGSTCAEALVNGICVPTISTWGVAALVLLMLSAATIVIKKQVATR